ncbi:MAG TPA: acylase, partial [Allocoleopsis sp.]
GIFRVLDFAPTDSGSFQAVGGDSFVAAVEFSNPVRAKVLTSYGNATQQSNAVSASDQLSFVAQQQLRPAWRSRTEIESHLSAQESIPRI